MSFLVLRIAEAIDTGVNRQTDPAYMMEFYRRVSSEVIAADVLRTLVQIASTKADPWGYLVAQVEEAQ